MNYNTASEYNLAYFSHQRMPVETVEKDKNGVVTGVTIDNTGPFIPKYEWAINIPPNPIEMKTFTEWLTHIQIFGVPKSDLQLGLNK